MTRPPAARAASAEPRPLSPALDSEELAESYDRVGTRQFEHGEC